MQLAAAVKLPESGIEDFEPEARLASQFRPLHADGAAFSQCVLNAFHGLGKRVAGDQQLVVDPEEALVRDEGGKEAAQGVSSQSCFSRKIENWNSRHFAPCHAKEELLFRGGALEESKPLACLRLGLTRNRTNVEHASTANGGGRRSLAQNESITWQQYDRPA